MNVVTFEAVEAKPVLNVRLDVVCGYEVTIAPAIRTNVRSCNYRRVLVLPYRFVNNLRFRHPDHPRITVMYYARYGI